MKRIGFFILATIFLLLIGYVVGSSIKKGIQKNKTEKTRDSLKVQASWLLNGEFANVCSAIVND